eukprot:CAMPEP_0205799880 /NCGR_PEP_ID=MMETSP0205-20121125/1350_1 /ASSEMBLY_ACC=CAM_ASM_000278 /TAXON_ID=36767 /ORGANISM="Euplotes focardii, Strain TN1" /LENGTH=206 /DNA_ID=CAMNT_0053062033 /DNA_START=195 /DNA_END=812 /DNA_ORIENTATION=+
MGEDVDFNLNFISDEIKNEISKITEDHSDKLNMLREQYDGFLKTAESEFFEVLRMIKIEPSGKSEPDMEEVKEDFKEEEEKEEHENRREGGDLAKMAREFLEEQERNLGVIQDRPSHNTLMPKSSNSAYTFNKLPEDIQRNEDQYVKVNDLLNNEYAKSGMSVFDFNPAPHEKENESDMSIASQVEFVDYNQEAKRGGYTMLSSSN